MIYSITRKLLKIGHLDGIQLLIHDMEHVLQVHLVVYHWKTKKLNKDVLVLKISRKTYFSKPHSFTEPSKAVVTRLTTFGSRVKVDSGWNTADVALAAWPFYIFTVKIAKKLFISLVELSFFKNISTSFILMQFTTICSYEITIWNGP